MSCATGLVGQDPLFRATDGGTSEAAASVAGLAAYFLGFHSLASQANTPAKLKAFIETTAIPRGPAGEQLLCTYNGILFAQAQTNPQCPVVARDGILSDGCAALSSNIPSPPSDSPLMSTPSVPTTFFTVTSSNQSAIPSIASSAIGSLSSLSSSSSSPAASSSISSPVGPLTTMQPVTAASNSITAKSSASVSLPDCSNTAIQVPGECGIPECAYVLIADGGSDLCSTNYCDCGDGFISQPFTAVVSGSLTENCAYPTTPPRWACPIYSGTKVVAPGASPTPTPSKCITCPGGAEANTDAAAKCPPDLTSWVADNW
jgi:hypothetical protein